MYTYGNQEFRTKKELTEYIQKAIGFKDRILGREFFDEVLADLFFQKHWAFKGRKPSSFRFQKNEERDGRLWGDSLAANLEGEWVIFSYQNLLKESQWTFEVEFNTLCRHRFGLLRKGLFDPHKMCEFEQCSQYAIELDHIEPQHREIVEKSLALVTPDVRTLWLKELEDPRKHFTLPEGHPVTDFYDRLTLTARYQHLCKAHHRYVTAIRTAKDPSKVKVPPIQIGSEVLDLS